MILISYLNIDVLSNFSVMKINYFYIQRKSLKKESHITEAPIEKGGIPSLGPRSRAQIFAEAQGDLGGAGP